MAIKLGENVSRIPEPLSNDVRLLFRSISLVKPDMGMIMRAKCAAMGFKCSVVLGSRLKLLTELSKDQL